MALDWCDSFDLYTTLADGGYGNNTGAISAGTGRFGGGSYRTTANSHHITRSLKSTLSSVIGAISFNAITAPDNAGGQLVGLMFRDAGSDQIGFYVRGTDWKIGLLRGASEIATSALTLSGTGTYHRIELKATVNNAGTAQVWVDGVLFIDFTGDTQATANATVDSYRLGNLQAFGSATTQDYDDLVIMDTTGSFMNDVLGDKKIVAVLADAEGNYSAFTPSTGTDNAALVDDAAPDADTTYVSSATPGDKDTYTHDPVSLTLLNIDAVVAVLRARMDDAGPRDIKALIRADGVDANGSETHSMTSTYAYYRSAFYQNPQSPVVDWSPESVNDTEIGEEVVT